MRLFVSVLLVTMVVVATLIDDSEGWRRRRNAVRRRMRVGWWVDKADGELMEVMQEARSLLEELVDLDEAPEPRMEEREYEEKGLHPDDRK